MSSAMHKAAREYAEAGFPVFPLSGKMPLEVAGQANIDGMIIPEGKGGFHQATINLSKIDRWWNQFPDANIGTPTGRHLDNISGEPNAKPFDVLDIDLGKDGLESIRKLIDANGQLPDTPQQRTGSGGFHFLFASDGTVRNSAGGIAPGIDVRGTGGYIVIPPSIHPKTLDSYDWLDGKSPLEAELSPWPDWLRKIIGEVSKRRNGATPGARIPLGVQEATLMRIAGAMRRQGSTEHEILAALTVISQERCDPPVSERDLARMAKSASNYAPGEALIEFKIDDGGNAERLVNRYGGQIRHAADARENGWYWFNGRIWEHSTSKIVQCQLETARAYQDAVDNIVVPEGNAEALAIKRAHEKNAKACAQERTMTAVRKIAATFPEIEIARTELDADPLAFACANGVIDLKTGNLREHDSRDLITRMSPVAYDPDARSALWDDFLRWLTKDRQELANFLQLAAGYSMTALTNEEKLFFLYGPAASGKTSFIEGLKMAFGSYAMTADFSTFLKGHNVGGPRSDIARLHGARFVSSVEVDQGKALAEGLVKQMTGGDTITARFHYQSEFEYNATHKLWLVANDAPKVSAEDDGLWRRILRIPCDNVVPEGKRDPLVKLRLKDAGDTGPAILAWMVEGALRWLALGYLEVPAAIVASTQEYRESQDPILDFITEVCQVDDKLKAEFGDLETAYVNYCRRYQRRPLGPRMFGDRLEARGFSRARSNGKRYIKGLALASTEF